MHLENWTEKIPPPSTMEFDLKIENLKSLLVTCLTKAWQKVYLTNSNQICKSSNSLLINHLAEEILDVSVYQTSQKDLLQILTKFYYLVHFLNFPPANYLPTIKTIIYKEALSIFFENIDFKLK